MDELQKSFSLPYFLTCLLIFHINSAAADHIINSSHAIRDGETMVSSSRLFELGFFSPGNSKNRYLGMWYKDITPKTVIWVANRQAPLTSKSGVLKVTNTGLLVLLNDTNGIIMWSSNMSRSVRNPVAELLDSGNLVVKDANDASSENYLWQSFDYASDTYIPGMSMGWNFVTGIETYMSSWKSNDDPAPGEISLHLDPTGYPQLLMKRGNVVLCRFGPWNGLRFNGAQHIADPAYRLTRQDLEMNKNEVKYRQDTMDGSVVVARNTLGQNGVVRRWTWNDRTQDWENYFSMPADNCDSYNLCGAHGICNLGNFPSCECLDGFVPKDPQNWNRANWSNGCIRKAPLNCQGDIFLKYSGIKLPDARYSWFNQSMSPSECEAECLRNCSCRAYTQLDIREGGHGCLFYNGELIDLKNPSPDEQDIYIRMASSTLEHLPQYTSMPVRQTFKKGREHVDLKMSEEPDFR
ncbi:Non-specific serine/threonine protein kinase [Handroanthus impetiginosus]|uniref:non-specific serine/threonine protein kinase n=1 Tax=Handroanthus impetiginosus TaxID=429701 RepID=A0A2G9HZV9_9LAMI|nr:Non-specific serine/threonine protein kinase [Handroanthus impetiginosus]